MATKTKGRKPAKTAPRTKAQRSEGKYLQTSIAVLEGSGRFREKQQPFSYASAIKQFHSWCYSAASMNANAVASTPLRLYVRARSTGQKLYPTRKMSRTRKAFMCGDLVHRPGHSVLKAFGDMSDY
jgi:hypothetical protein